MTIKNSTTISILIFIFSSFQILAQNESEILPEGIVFPRMTTVDRDALTPVQGQCIYNTTTLSINCYDGTNWVDTGSGGSGSTVQSIIQDADGDTSVDVESTTDNDEIQIHTDGQLRFKFIEDRLEFENANNSIYIGEDAGLNSDPNANLENTFVGNGSGKFNTTGYNNSFLGYLAGYTNSTGYENAFFGWESGRKNLGGEGNSYFGNEAGHENQSGQFNSLFGSKSGFKNTGSANSFFGWNSGYENLIGASNSFFGAESGYNNTNGSGNSFFGNESGYNNTLGYSNSFFGLKAGNKNTEGFYNSFFGANAGNKNTIGDRNSFFGVNAGYDNVDGTDNSFFGVKAGYENTGGTGNSFFGVNTGQDNTTGYANSYFGANAGLKSMIGHNNSFFGFNAGKNNTDGFHNSFFGTQAGNDNTLGEKNSFFGFQAGEKLSTSDLNSFYGYQSGGLCTSGNENAYFGSYSGYGDIPNSYSVTGYQNAFFGTKSGYRNSSGHSNSFFGHEAGYHNANGSRNTYIGYEAGKNNIYWDDLTGDLWSGNGNVFIGYKAGGGDNNEERDGKLYIENSASSYPLIYGDFTQDIAAINGRFGIGTQTGISEELVIEDADTDGDVIQRLEVSDKNLQLGYNTSLKSHIGTKSSHEFSLITDNTERLRVFSDGKVSVLNNLAIGTVSGINDELRINDTDNDNDVFMKMYANSANMIVGYNSSSQGILGMTTNHKLGFRTNNSTRMTILKTGEVGIGTGSPSQKLHVEGNICYTGSSSSCSDLRYKKDIVNIPTPLNKVTQLNGVYYHWKTKEFSDKEFSEDRQIGVIAQEVESLFPELVFTDREGYKTVDYSKLTPILIEAIKELKNELENKTAEHESEINVVKAELNELKAAVNSILDNKSKSDSSISDNEDYTTNQIIKD